MVGMVPDGFSSVALPRLRHSGVSVHSSFNLMLYVTHWVPCQLGTHSYILSLSPALMEQPQTRCTYEI